MDQVVAQRQQSADRGHGCGRLRDPVAAKVQVSDAYLESSHRSEHTREAAVAEGGPHISTHILDAQRGGPAGGVRVRLEHIVADGAPVEAGSGRTDADGRIARLSDRPLVVGTYRLTFDLHDYSRGFFGTIALELHVTDAGRNYHVPLLVSPFAITVYRGS
jgi:hydroxyisourate hydrolase